MDAVKRGLSSVPLVNKIRWDRVFLVFAVVVIIGVCVYIALKNAQILATPENISRIRNTQMIEMEKRWIGISQKRRGIYDAFSQTPIADSQKLLINTSVLGMRLGGCLGPFSSPVFDEAAATRFALASGARCLVLEIDRLQDDVEPKLIYRDPWGMKRSLNTGSIELVAKQIAGRAFSPGNDSTPPGVAQDPFILVLYFVNTPSPAEKPLEYCRFLAKVSVALQPLKNLVLGQTPQGDFRRQALESQLFYQDLDTLKQRIIVLTNADTTPFRRLQQLGLAGELGPEHDLDLLVHARLYSRESPSGLGITAAPAGTQQASAVITTPKYWLNTPPDRLADAVSQTKKAWTLVMSPVAGENEIPNPENLKKLLVTYGVHSMPMTLFETEETTKSLVGTAGVYENFSWVTKPELIRYVPVPPIVTQKPIPQTDSGGGAIRSPV